MRGITNKVKPPRAVYVRFPLGSVTGSSFDIQTQTQVLEAALTSLETMKEPGQIIKLPFEYNKTHA